MENVVFKSKVNGLLFDSNNPATNEMLTKASKDEFVGIQKGKNYARNGKPKQEDASDIDDDIQELN